jgi:hypothetical protein
MDGFRKVRTNFDEKEEDDAMKEWESQKRKLATSLGCLEGREDNTPST